MAASIARKLGFWEHSRGGPPANPGEIRWIVTTMPCSKADFRFDFIEFMVFRGRARRAEAAPLLCGPDIEQCIKP